MPFIPKEERRQIQEGTLQPTTPGQLCYMNYSNLVEHFVQTPRWSTIHNEFKNLTGADDKQTACFLAFLEFYFNYGHPYEVKMAGKNGGI